MLALAARMPPDLKLRGLKRKYILKKAAEKLLPREVVWRKKAGFGAPIRSWLRGPLQPMVNDLLSEETIKRRGLFQAARSTTNYRRESFRPRGLQPSGLSVAEP